jgi:hypothetical protein
MPLRHARSQTRPRANVSHHAHELLKLARTATPLREPREKPMTARSKDARPRAKRSELKLGDKLMAEAASSLHC